MTLFELVKQTIQVRDAAEHYGLQINHSGMCRCPFHEDRHPSMKLNERYFYCRISLRRPSLCPSRNAPC